MITKSLLNKKTKVRIKQTIIWKRCVDHIEKCFFVITSKLLNTLLGTGNSLLCVEFISCTFFENFEKHCQTFGMN